MDRKGNKIHSIQKKKFGSVEFLFSTLIKFVSILVCTIYIRTLVPSLKKKKTQKVYISAVSPPSLSISPSLYAAVSSFFCKSSSSKSCGWFPKITYDMSFFPPKKIMKKKYDMMVHFFYITLFCPITYISRVLVEKNQTYVALSFEMLPFFTIYLFHATSISR